MKSRPILSRSISALLLLLAPVGAHAVEKTLANPATSWFTGPWGPAGLPGTGDNVVITASPTIDIRGSAAWTIANTTEVQDMVFNSTAALTLSNQSTGSNMTLILNGGRGAGVPLIATTGDFAYTITGINGAATPRTFTLQLKASGDISVAANVLTIGSRITESGGARSLNKTGAGRLILGGASLFAGGATVTAGVLEATNNGALGTGAAVVNGGTLELNLANSTYTASSITANAGGRVAVRNVTTNSAVTLAGGTLGTRTGDAGTYAGPVNVTADSSAAIISYTTPANNNSITISGKLSGASALSVTGNLGNSGLKALILTNVTNDFSGVYNVTAGQRLSSVPATTGNTLGTGSVNLTGGFLGLNDNGSGVDGTLTYGNNITVGAGGGTINLDRVSGVNTGNTFALGTLSIGAETLVVNGGANGYKATFTGGTLTGAATINSTGGVTIAGAIAGGFGLTKDGAGTLTLGGLNGYAGATTVTAGTLNLTGSVAAGVAVGGSGTLAGNGTVTGTTTVANAGVISPGIAGSGTLAMGGLTFGSAATDTATVNFTTNATPGNISVTGAGGLVANGDPGTVSLNLLSTLPAVGLHTIIDYSGAIGGTNGFSAFTLAPLPNPRIVATLQNDLANTRIVLNVTGVDTPRWSGGLSSEWSTVMLGTPKNWSLVLNAGTTDYIEGDQALFDDLAATTAVLLNVEDVAPASVVFDNSIAKNYTLGGTFAITGATGLVKTKNGTVTISNTNTFTGPVSISTGTVSVNAVADSAAGSPLGAGSVVNIAGGGTLEVTGAGGSTNRALNINAGGGTLKVAAASTLTQAGAVAAAGNFTLDNAGIATISGAIGASGDVLLTGAGATTVAGTLSVAGVLTKAGSGTATLTAAGNTPSSTTISAGILRIGDGVASGSIGNGPITNNATLAFNNPAGVTAGGAIGGTGALTKTGAGNTTLNGATANTYSGDTTVSGGNLVLSKTSGVDAIGGNLFVELGGTVSYGTTGGQLADHIPDNKSITINGGTFGSGAGATLAAPTTGVTDTVTSVTVNSGSFLSGRGPGTTPAPFTVLGDFKLFGGTALVQRGGGLTAKSVQVGAAVLDLDGGSGTANNQSRLNVGTDGLSLAGATINFNAGPSAVVAGSLGSVVTLTGNVTSTGTSLLARLNPTLSAARVDLALGVRTFDVTGTLTVAPDVGIAADLAAAGLVKTGPGKLVLEGAQNYASLTSNAGRTDVLKTIGTGTSTVTASGGTINLAEGQTLTSITIADGATVNFGPPLPAAPAEAFALAGATAVPEPGGAALLLGGLAMLLGLRRRHG